MILIKKCLSSTQSTKLLWSYIPTLFLCLYLIVAMKEAQSFSPFLNSRIHLLQDAESHQLLQSKSEEAQTLRRSLLRNASVLIVGGGPESKLRFFRHLASLEVQVFLMDNPNGPWSKIASHADSPFAGFLPADLSDLESISIKATESIKGKKCFPKRFDAVFSLFELYVEHAAIVNKVLSPSRDYTTFARCARNKASTRDALIRNQIPTPRYYKISTTADIFTACAHVGFPSVLKPISGVLSTGVINVNSVEQVFDATIRAFQQTVPANLLTSDPPDKMNQGGNQQRILEEFLDGPEFDVDLLLSYGDVVYARVTDNWAFEPPWCQDCGLQGPSRLSLHQQQELIDMATKCVKALGGLDGVVHAELRYTSDGPRLIEINARMGGAAIFDLHQRVWGVDLIENHCMSMCGIPIRPMSCEKPLCHFTCIILYAPYSGRVTSDKWLEFLCEEDGVINVIHEKEKGALVLGPECACPDWIGQVYVIGKSKGEVDSKVKDIVTGKAPVPILPNDPGRIRPYFFPGNKFPFSHT